MMKSKKKSVFITLFAVVAAILIILWSRTPDTKKLPSGEAQQDISFEQSTPQSLDEEHMADAELENLQELQGRGLPEFRPLLQYCLDQYPQYPSFPTPEELSRLLQHNDLKQMWNNLHLETLDGEIYRVRTFVDQGIVGPVTRLAVYKEDEEGFPVLIELPEEEKINPDHQVLERYLSLGSIIHQEKAVVLDLEQAEYFFETHNNELVRMDITGGDGVLNCQFTDHESGLDQ
jgi:hypothetical protein